MPQVKEIITQKKLTAAYTNSNKKDSIKAITKFMEELGKGISVEELRTNLLNNVYIK